MNFWEKCRADGYIDALKGAPNHRLRYPPEARSFYEAGRRDGLERARAEDKS